MHQIKLTSAERAERTILPLKNALSVTAKRMGIAQIAAAYGHGAQQLYNNLNINDPGRMPTLEQFENITEFAVSRNNAHLIYLSLSHLLNAAVIKLPDVKPNNPKDLLNEISSLVASVSKLTTDVSMALSDGVVNPTELAILERDLLQLFTDGMTVVEQAKRIGDNA